MMNYCPMCQGAGTTGGLIKGLKAKMKDLPEFAVPGGKYPRNELGRDAYERDIIAEFKASDQPWEIRKEVGNYNPANSKKKREEQIRHFKYVRSGLAYPPVSQPRRLGAKAQARRDEARERASEKQEVLKLWRELVAGNPACQKKTARSVKGRAGIDALKAQIAELYEDE